MANKIITPAEVVSMAFTDGEYIAAGAISDIDIEAAVTRWIEPVTGKDICAAVRGGAYADFKSGYMAPALAAYVRVLVQPRLNVSTAQGGLSAPAGIYRKAAEESARIELNRVLELRAHELLRRMSDYLDANAASMPEYDPKTNILKRCNCYGGFVQVL